MDVGKIEYLDDGYFEGEITTLALDFKISLEHRQNRQSDKEPNFDVYAKGMHGRRVAVGVGWEYQIRKGRLSGHPMMQLKLDDPSFEHPLEVSAFPTGDNRTWRVSFERARGGRRAADADQQAAPSQSEAA